MKIASIIAFTIALVCAAVSKAATLPDVDDEWQLFSDIASLSQSGDYDRIYDFLDGDYRRRVTKEFFVRSSKESGWTLLKPRMGTIQGGERTSYAPVRGSVKTHAKVYDIDAVLFFAKEGNKRKIRNFPFLPEHMPNWPELPIWLE